VIVENRGGAGGNIGIAAAARAGGDGYTLLVCSSATWSIRASTPRRPTIHTRTSSR
jgi:tripartite-type tricarboxylate transporter receptor subunit TctC